MVTYVENKLYNRRHWHSRVECALYASNALAKRCSFALCVGNTLCNRNQLATLFTIRLKLLFFYFFMRGLCAGDVCLAQTSVNENTKNLERVLYLCLTLDWRWCDVILASTFTRGKTLTFLSMQKMCAEVDAHNKRITFTRRSRQIFNKFWRTPSESQRTDQYSSFFVRWSFVKVCARG